MKTPRIQLWLGWDKRRSSNGLNCAPSRAWAAQRAVTLLEMLVAVSLLVLIMGGLFLSYYHVQRAYGLATAQQDVLEGGRATLNLVRRDLALMSASMLPGVVNTYAEDVSTNFGNVIQDVYWVQRNNDAYAGVGYIVQVRGAGVGTLWRFETDGLQTNTIGFFARYLNPSTNNLQRVAEGVVRLRLTPYDQNNQLYNLTNIPQDMFVLPNGFASTNQALPSYLEMELGLLDQQTLRVFNAFTNVGPAQATQFLSTHLGKIYTFRQRIPIQNRQ